MTLGFFATDGKVFEKMTNSLNKLVAMSMWQPNRHVALGPVDRPKSRPFILIVRLKIRLSADYQITDQNI